MVRNGIWIKVPFQAVNVVIRRSRPGCLGDSVRHWTLVFSSDCDLRILRWSPASSSVLDRSLPAPLLPLPSQECSVEGIKRKRKNRSGPLSSCAPSLQHGCEQTQAPGGSNYKTLHM